MALAGDGRLFVAHKDGRSVRDIAATRAFYGELLGCPEGRSSERWVDFDFFGHQVVAQIGRAHV